MNKQSFADLGVSPVVARTLAGRGLESPFPVQASVIPDVLAGHDVLVKSPTGSGKTLALGVPLVDLIEASDARAAALVQVASSSRCMTLPRKGVQGFTACYGPPSG